MSSESCDLSGSPGKKEQTTREGPCCDKSETHPRWPRQPSGTTVQQPLQQITSAANQDVAWPRCNVNLKRRAAPAATRVFHSNDSCSVRPPPGTQLTFQTLFHGSFIGFHRALRGASERLIHCLPRLSSRRRRCLPTRYFRGAWQLAPAHPAAHSQDTCGNP